MSPQCESLPPGGSRSGAASGRPPSSPAYLPPSPPRRPGPLPPRHPPRYATAPQVFSNANEILAGISHPSVCSEVLLSAPGTAYILGLSEVYRVSKRLEEGMKARRAESEALLHCLHKVDLAWNNLLSFLIFGHSVLQVLNVNLLESSDESDSLSASNLAPEEVCGVCLTEVKREPQVSSGNSGPVMHQGSCYHASCANFWLNCVDATLPGGS